MSPKKLIEVSIPLEAINKASKREKSINHKHPSTLHLWWSRKPLATARAVLWASLVDDPSENPEKFPTLEAQEKERKRLHEILVELVQWKNINNPETLRKARAELPKNPPELLDPFAGGGSIPLEGQRLGLKVNTRDLNPVAVIINEAMTKIPAKFCNMPPVNPEARKLVGWENSGNGTQGLAQDITYYGERLKEKAFAAIGHMYPEIMTPEGPAKVIAWLWARTVKCPNPSCGQDMPLVSSWELSRKNKAYAAPHYSNGTLSFSAETGNAPASPKTGKGKFTCSACGSVVANEYLHEEFCAHRDGVRMIAVVAERPNGKGRVYLSPNEEHERVADVPMPEDYPDAEMMGSNRYVSPRLYGMPNFADLFTNRQLTMLTTIADLIPEIVSEAERDAEEAGRTDAKGYAEALRVYLAFVLDKLTDYHSAFCSWHTVRDLIRNTFSKQAIPMVWDYAEGNPFCNSSGCFNNMLKQIVNVVENLPCYEMQDALQHNAMERENLQNKMISTDPPYYDNIGYADLSDYFYIWLRRTLRGTYPELFRRMLVPKDEELIVAPHRHGGDPIKARKFFEDGMKAVCDNLCKYACDNYPSTIYYAYKSGDKDGGNSGWETMLSAVINVGFQITGTWPMRTELTNRSVALGTAALASSIVLVCRKRSPDAPGTSKAAFLRELKRELGPALKKMQEGNIAPVDLPQSAIGPGMAVYSKYLRVVDTDGKIMTVHDALIEVNKVIDEGFGDIDSMSRFCVNVYRISGWNAIKAGDAITLANACSVSLDGMENEGLISAEKSDVRLMKRETLKECRSNSVWCLTQRMAYALENGGRDSCGMVAAAIGETAAEKVKELAYHLYTVAERRRWADETRIYNNLISEWQKIKESASKIGKDIARQLSFGLEDK